MTSETVMSMTYLAMKVALFMAGPLLLVTLAVGLLISIFQAATQINEMTLSFIPKLLAVGAALVLLGPWLITSMVAYLQNRISQVPGQASSAPLRRRWHDLVQYRPALHVDERLFVAVLPLARPSGHRALAGRLRHSGQGQSGPGRARRHRDLARPATHARPAHGFIRRDLDIRAAGIDRHRAG